MRKAFIVIGGAAAGVLATWLLCKHVPTSEDSVIGRVSDWVIDTGNAMKDRIASLFQRKAPQGRDAA